MGKRAASAGLLVALFVSSSDAQGPGAAPAPPTVFERNTQPIEIFKTGLGTFTRRDMRP
jgi:hypothetical protein